MGKLYVTYSMKKAYGNFITSKIILPGFDTEQLT